MSERSLTEIVREIQNKVKGAIRLGKSHAEITRALVPGYAEHLEVDEVKRIINEQVYNFPNYAFIQQLMRSKIVQEINGKSNYILDPLTRRAEMVAKERIQDAISPKLDITDKYVVARFTYDPFKLKQLFQDDHGNWFYNLYQPPFWQADYFFSNGDIDIEPVHTLPDIYKKFLNHLVDNDPLSFEYVLDWMANAIQRRNFCILTTIGVPGAGKGTLGEIMKNVVGDTNFIETGNRILAERFNSQIKNRRIVSCDEFSVRDNKEEERLKVLVNNFLEVEAKGKDAEVIHNYASFYFSSNNIDSLRLPDDDRRFSIVSLTDKKLTTILNSSDIKFLTAKENIDQLARYLYYRPVDEDRMLKVFKSKRTEEVRSASLAGWHDWFLDEYAVENAGKCIKIEEVSNVVEDRYGSKYKPSRSAFQRLEKIYPARFNVCRKTLENRQIWCIVFPETVVGSDQ